jgi:apolipoprotein N-acyltransferase
LTSRDRRSDHAANHAIDYKCAADTTSTPASDHVRPYTVSSLPSTLALPVAMVAGAINVLAFAPFSLWPLQILTLALIFRLVLSETSFKRSALIGWAYGFGWSVAGVHWLYISMHRYGGLPAWMTVIAVALLGVLLGGFAALGMGGSTWLKQRWSSSARTTALGILPVLWLLAEWTRGWMFTGFPWVSSGYAHTSGPLAGFAPLIGVYGLAWISALIAGSLALLPSNKRSALLALAALAAGFGLKTVDWTSPNGQAISVRLLQGNVPQEMKFAPERIEATLALYYGMIGAKPADLIATPETAIPLLSSQLPPDYLGLLRKLAVSSNSHVALGIPVSDGPRRYANSMIGLSPDAATLPYRYDKHHLVPFGEFIPPGARWFVDMMNIPLGDYTRGRLLQPPFSVRDQWVLPNICYEDLFGEEIAAQLAAGGTPGMPQATILLNLSNIAWFGDSIALPQHLQISQMRALETGRPMLRATNTGTTAVIDPKGQVVASLRPFERSELAATVQGFKGLTPYSRFGNTPVVTAALLLLFSVWLQGRNNPHKPTKNR